LFALEKESCDVIPKLFDELGSQNWGAIDFSWFIGSVEPKFLRFNLNILQI
jgi:hypothetical protein